MAERSLRRSLGNLLLALLNATLILAALCLLLTWNVLNAAERVSEDIREATEAVLPLRTEVRDLSAEIAAARAELVALRTEGVGARDEIAALEAGIAGVETQLRALSEAVTDAAGDADAMIEQAVESAFAELGETVASILSAVRGREPASSQP